MAAENPYCADETREGVSAHAWWAKRVGCFRGGGGGGGGKITPCHSARGSGAGMGAKHAREQEARLIRRAARARVALADLLARCIRGAGGHSDEQRGEREGLGGGEDR
jgi:hypothetical protein